MARTEELSQGELNLILDMHPDISKRIAAGEKIVENYISHGAYGGLIRISEDGALPVPVRDKAKESIVLSAERKIERCIKEGEYEMLRKISEDDALHESLKERALQNINIAAETYIQNTRGKGETDGRYYALKQLLNDKELPENLIEKAKKALVEFERESIEIDIEREDSSSLENIMYTDFYFSEESRILAGKWVVEMYVKRGEYNNLVEISRKENVPEEVRTHASKAIPKSVENCIERYVKNGLYEVLLSMAEDSNVPEFLQVKAKAAIGRAGERAIEEAFQYENEQYLINMLEDQSLPKETRTKAKRELEKFVEVFGDRLPTSHPQHNKA